MSVQARAHNAFQNFIMHPPAFEDLEPERPALDVSELLELEAPRLPGLRGLVFDISEVTKSHPKGEDDI